MATASANVFINCPFDPKYAPIFDAIIFAVCDTGFLPRCSLEFGDGLKNRLDNIQLLIHESRYGIHDISRTELSTVGKGKYPRFNMPLELGLFMGASRYGGARHRDKCCLILDKDEFRYRISTSDIAGQDIAGHGDDPVKAINEVCKWLSVVSGRHDIPGGANVNARFAAFQSGLPTFYATLHKKPDEVTFPDYHWAIFQWIHYNLRP